MKPRRALILRLLRIIPKAPSCGNASVPLEISNAQLRSLAEAT